MATSDANSFTCTHHEEVEDFVEDAINMAKMIREAKSNTESFQKLFARITWLTPSRLERPKTVQLQHGDFGEALAIGLVEWSTTQLIPVVKLRYQVDKDQSQHGTDIVAFLLDDDAENIADMEFCEVKVRSSGRSNAKGAALEAHKQLTTDRDLCFADILDFIFQRLDESDPTSAAALERYLSRRDDPGGAYRIIVIVDRNDFSEDILDQLPAPPELCEPLHIDIVHCDELKALIAETWELVPPDVIANSSGDRGVDE
jgi:hypothetical protein